MTLIAMNPIQMLTRSVSRATSFKAGLTLVAVMCATASFAQGESGANNDLSTFVDPGASGANVDKATGAFSFSMPLMTLPGAAGEGYPIVLGYAPPSPDEPASWVGYGWSLGPGAVSRSVNGIPDDFNGIDITNISKTPVHHKITLNSTAGFEVFSNSALGLTKGIAWDSERGILPSFSLSLNGFGAGLSYMQEAGKGAFSANFSPVTAAMSVASKASNSSSNPGDSKVVAQLGYGDFMKHADVRRAVGKRALTKLAMKQGVSWGPRTMAMPIYQNGVFEKRFSGEFSGQFAFIPDGGPEVGFRVSYDRTRIDMIDAVKTYGYLHSQRVSLTDESTLAAMDFFEERPHTLDEYDRFIPMPVQTPDQFSVSAGNLSGSFRGHQIQPGTYYPRGLEHSSSIGVDLGVELGAGFGPASANTVVGGSVSLDLSSEADIRTWTPTSSSGLSIGFGMSPNGRFFAFKGDVGLQRRLADEGVVPRATPKFDFKNYRAATYFGKDATRHHELELSGFDPAELFREDWRPELNRTIRWNIAKAMDDAAGIGPVFFNQFDKRDFSSFVDYGSLPQDGITEFEIVDESGTRYAFGIPVYQRKQLDLSFSTGTLATAPVGQSVVFEPGPSVADIFAGPADDEAWKDILSDWDRVQGKYIEKPVATSWLLTAITSPDYVDITGDGCTDDDLGTWVKFHYAQQFGGANKSTSSGWYNYRDPVSGSRYSQGSEADDKDNMASFSCGQKEVYVLQEIETRTHRAVFTTSPRDDGASIQDFNAAYLHDSWNGSQELHRLDRIELKAKNLSGGTDVTLQTIDFHYSYSSWPANDVNQGGLSTGGTVGNMGARMTLEGITTSSFEVSEDARTTQFEYAYPEYNQGAADPLPWLDDADLQSKYASIFEENADLIEAPHYLYNTSDAWGLSKDYGTDYWSRHHRWRRPNAGMIGTADPAAYCLKQIILPTGARVLPQYERSDYRWVQDELAEVMVPLKSTGGSTHDRIYLDENYLTNDLGWNLTMSEMVQELNQRLTGRRTYYKPLYYMPVGASPGTPGVGASGWNYFPGFIQVEQVGQDGTGIYLDISTTGNYSLPQQTCQDFCLKYPRISTDGMDYDLPGDEELMSSVSTILDKAIQPNALYSANGLLNCTEFYEPESYVRIPLLGGNSKSGGRPRIKRLMVYDPGIVQGAGTGSPIREGELLTGTEYRYETWNANLERWVSSGVAANEPKSMYEECTLFDPLPKASQGQVERFLGGKDTETQAGPVGESFLPSPMVTYEEVTERSIHDDISGEGEVVCRYYSHRTHPVQVAWTNPSTSQLDKVEPNPLSSLINPVTLKALWYSQGLRITTNDMAGKMRSITSYGAERDPEGVRVPVSKTVYHYRNPGEGVTVMDGVNTLNDPVSFGAFDEAYTLGRFIRNHKVNGRVEVDFNASITVAGIPFAFPSIWPSGAVMTEIQGTHATVLQSHRPAIIESIHSEKSGMETVVSHLAYDALTSQPVLTATTDGYSDVLFDPDGAGGDPASRLDQRLLNLSVSAVPIYDEIGKTSKNDRLVLKPTQGLLEDVAEIHCESESFSNGSGVEVLAFLKFCPVLNGDLCGILGEDGLFYPGDLLKVQGKSHTGSRTTGFWHVESVDGNRVYVQPSRKMSSFVAVSVENIEIVRSGRSNELGASFAKLSAYDDALTANTSPNPEAEPFRNLALWLNNNVIPTPPSGTGASAKTTNILTGDWNAVSIEEADCQAMNAGIGLNQFYMEFGGTNSCGTGYISFPNPPNITTTTVTTNTGGGSGYTEGNGDPVGGGGNGVDPPATGRVVHVGAQYIIPIHYNTDARGAGQFYFDGELGAIVWSSPDAECSPTVVFTACQDFSDIVTVDNVMQASATSLSDHIPQPDVNFAGTAYSDRYEFGNRGRWTPETQLVFNSTASSYLNGASHSTQVGLLDDFSLVSPHHIAYSNSHWIHTQTHLRIDERSRVTSQADAYGYGHAVKFSQGENRPIWTVHGSSEHSCSFESFENLNSSGVVLTDSGMPMSMLKGQRSDEEAHSGRHSWKFGLTSNCSRALLPTVTLDEKTWDQGLRIRFWAHEPRHGTTHDKKYVMDDLFKVGLHGGTLTNPNCSAALTYVTEADSLVQTGKWVLIEAIIPSDTLAVQFAPGDILQPVVECDRTPGAPQNVVYIDDVRVQPTRAQMTCAVFDPADFRLLVDFDGNHFGSYHQYNHKGERIRTQLETEAGLKTADETHRHVLEN